MAQDQARPQYVLAARRRGSFPLDFREERVEGEALQLVPEAGIASDRQRVLERKHILDNRAQLRPL